MEMQLLVEATTREEKCVIFGTYHRNFPTFSDNSLVVASMTPMVAFIQIR